MLMYLVPDRGKIIFHRTTKQNKQTNKLLLFAPILKQCRVSGRQKAITKTKHYLKVSYSQNMKPQAKNNYCLLKNTNSRQTETLHRDLSTSF